MFRGTTFNKIARWFAAAAIYLAADGALLAGTTGRSEDVVKGKLTAPGLEDHANYFAENRKDLPPETLEKADKIRRKTIASIRDLLDSKKKSIRRFELLLRLGELYVERHDYLRDVELTKFENSWDKWNTSTDKSKAGAEPKVDYAGSEGELTKAANSFRQLVTEFPKEPRTDAALYSLAKTLARLGKDTSVDYYKQLIRSFPKSPLIPDTYLALGEYYFDKHDVVTSITYYKKVMAFKDHKAYPYAVYKLGWANYNAPAKNDAEVKDSLAKAVAAFKLVVKLADAAAEKRKDGEKTANNFSLRDEAIKDLIMVWADAEDVASAWKYFKTIGDTDSFYKMLERLGNIYCDHGKNQQAIAVFQRLLKDAPKREGNPQVHAKLLELYDVTGQVPQVIVELRNMQKLYLGDSAWVRANKAEEKAAPEATHTVELNMHRFGALFHQRAQKSNNETLYRSAAEIYKMYLESFAQEGAAYDIRYYLAEILYDFKQYEPASDHYMKVAKASPTGKYMKPAALNAVAAMNQLVQSKKWGQLPPLGQAPKPITIPHEKQKFVEQIDQYVALLPKEKDGEPMRFTAAQIQFEYGHYPEAIKRFEKITKDIPQTTQARASVRMILGFYADKEDWNKLISWAQTFNRQDKAGPKLMDAELSKYTLDLLRGSMFKRALAYEKTGKHEQAARSFIEYQKEFPQDPSADRALYNAMLNFIKIDKIEVALTTGNQLLDKYPKSALFPDVIASVASTYESLAKFEQAASLYRRLSANFPADKRAPSALYNAAVLYKGLKKTPESIEILKEFVAKYPADRIAADATLELATLYERTNQMPLAIQTYAAYAQKYSGDRDANLFAAAKAASLKTTNGKLNEGKAELLRLHGVLAAKDGPAALEARSTVAAALFKIMDPEFSKFLALKITDGSKIEQQVGDKQQKLVALADGYQGIIALGAGEFTVASLYRLGEAHENFSQALFKAPGPKGASQADTDKLKTELEKVAFPLKEEAYKFFETAYKRSKEVETFTAWTRRTYQKMVELSPDKHPAVDEISAEPAYLGHDIKITPAVAELIEK